MHVHYTSTSQTGRKKIRAVEQTWKDFAVDAAGYVPGNDDGLSSEVTYYLFISWSVLYMYMNSYFASENYHTYIAIV